MGISPLRVASATQMHYITALQCYHRNSLAFAVYEYSISNLKHVLSLHQLL